MTTPVRLSYQNATVSGRERVSGSPDVARGQTNATPPPPVGVRERISQAEIRAGGNVKDNKVRDNKVREVIADAEATPSFGVGMEGNKDSSQKSTETIAEVLAAPATYDSSTSVKSPRLSTKSPRSPMSLGGKRENISEATGLRGNYEEKADSEADSSTYTPAGKGGAPFDGEVLHRPVQSSQQHVVDNGPSSATKGTVNTNAYDNPTTASSASIRATAERLVAEEERLNVRQFGCLNSVPLAVASILTWLGFFLGLGAMLSVYHTLGASNGGRDVSLDDVNCSDGPMWNIQQCGSKVLLALSLAFAGLAAILLTYGTFYLSKVMGWSGGLIGEAAAFLSLATIFVMHYSLNEDYKEKDGFGLNIASAIILFIGSLMGLKYGSRAPTAPHGCFEGGYTHEQRRLRLLEKEEEIRGAKMVDRV